jgi:hypothetical protein
MIYCLPELVASFSSYGQKNTPRYSIGGILPYLFHPHSPTNPFFHFHGKMASIASTTANTGIWPGASVLACRMARLASNGAIGRLLHKSAIRALGHTFWDGPFGVVGKNSFHSADRLLFINPKFEIEAFRAVSSQWSMASSALFMAAVALIGRRFWHKIAEF